ncbi:hypothetical protein C0992_002625 [Termitomyces sp. T32_za158]|nr:hypothetical protein C0992_002625 [Termitomyces sp. T32_za158]
MVSLASLLTFAVSALLLVPGISSTAVNVTRYHDMGNEAREILSRATPAPPHWVIYWDEFTGAITPPDVTIIKGFNVFALSFLLVEGAFDQAKEWTTLTDAQRATVKSQYAAAGIRLIVSVFGATDAPTSNGADPIATANTFAAFVLQYDLDGVDVDYEDFDAFNGGKAELSKLVIGKPATASDASNGFMSTSTLASCLQTAKAQGWSKSSSND